MENEPSHAAEQDEYAEIKALLCALRVEATPEAHFEERFIYDFHERLAHEAVSRSARSLLWEHLLQIISNMGGRRLAWSLSSFGAGVLCMGVLAWQYGGSAEKNLASHVCAIERSAATLHPGAAQEVASTTVTRAERKPYTERLMSSRMGEMPYLAGLDDDADFSYLMPSADNGRSLNVSVPGFVPGLAY